MKKGFLTKAFVAVGVMASALALSSVCAFAADTVWQYDSTATTQDIPDVFGFKDSKGDSTLNVTATGGGSRTGAFEEKIFGSGETATGCYKNQTGYNLKDCVSTDAVKSDGSVYGKKYAGFTPTESGLLTLYVINDTSGAQTDALRIMEASEYTGTLTSGVTGYVVDTNSSITYGFPKRDDTDIAVVPVAFSVTAGQRYYLCGNQKVILFKMIFTPSESDTQYVHYHDGTTLKNYAITYVSPTEVQSTTGDLILSYNGDELVSTSEVYGSVSIDGAIYTANSLFGKDGYLYASEITGVSKTVTLNGTSNTATPDFETIQSTVEAITKG